MLRRRHFAAGVAIGIAGSAQAAAEPEAFVLAPNGWVPNNQVLPVLRYRGVIDGSPDRTEALFARNDWPPQWRNGVYDFHHYHSTAHEVLGIVAGRARLALGGPGGREIAVEAGDVLVLPTGTGHCRLASSDDFLVIGAYPPDQHWDICRDPPDPAAIARMRHLAFPPSDPVGGANGLLPRLWRAA